MSAFIGSTKICAPGPCTLCCVDVKKRAPPPELPNLVILGQHYGPTDRIKHLSPLSAQNSKPFQTSIQSNDPQTVVKICAEHFSYVNTHQQRHTRKLTVTCSLAKGKFECPISGLTATVLTIITRQTLLKAYAQSIFLPLERQVRQAPFSQIKITNTQLFTDQ